MKSDMVDTSRLAIDKVQIYSYSALFNDMW